MSVAACVKHNLSTEEKEKVVLLQKISYAKYCRLLSETQITMYDSNVIISNVNT